MQLVHTKPTNIGLDPELPFYEQKGSFCSWMGLQSSKDSHWGGWGQAIFIDNFSFAASSPSPTLFQSVPTTIRGNHENYLPAEASQEQNFACGNAGFNPYVKC